MRDRLQSAVIFVVLCVAATTSMLAVAQQGDEPPPVFKASSLLAPALLKGPHHHVDEMVRTEGYFHEFTLTSPLGSFAANGRSQLAVRIHEITAIAALGDVSKTEVFLKAAGQSVVKVGEGVVAAAKDPVDTAKGVGAGVKRFGVNLGRRTQRAIDSAKDESDEGAPTGDSAGVSAASSVLGVTGATRRWAAKLGVDPYTTNKVLRDALQSVAKVDAAGSVATKVVLPVPQVIGMTANVGQLVWSKDPEELRKINEQRLTDLAVSDRLAKTLFANGWFTLTYQTRFIAALHAVRAKESADYVATAAEARSEREALFFIESAEMLQKWHDREPIARLLADSRALVALSRQGSAVALLPLDWVRWTGATERAFTEMSARTHKELGAGVLRAALTGRASDRATREMRARGWTLMPPP